MLSSISFFIVFLFQLQQAECSAEKIIHCGEIGTIQYGDVVASRQSPYSVGTTLTFNCDEGFKGRGKKYIKCLKSGQWSDPVPYCRPDSCQRMLSRVNAGRKCRKPCKKDSDCRGGFKRCLCDDWCGKSCFNPDADCAVPQAPENGYVIKNEISYGNTVTYGCNEGFSLTGPATRRCQSDRKWSGIQPECAAFSACGYSPYDLDKKIFGKVIHGRNARIGEWPWQVLLFHRNRDVVRKFYDTNVGFGGGSIIHSKWILTAAHVFEILPYRDKEKYFLIAAGMTSYPQQGQDIPDRINFYKANKIYEHKEYNSATFDYDIALLRVGTRMKQNGNKFVEDIEAPPGSITFTQFIRPVCLPCMKTGSNLEEVDLWKSFDKQACNPKSRSASPSEFKAGDKVIVTGFGKKRDIGDDYEYTPGVLQKGELELLADDKCAKEVRTLQLQDDQVRYTNRMICAESANKSLNVDACTGDSGGPLVKPLKKLSRNAYWLQIGVVSWGLKCGNKYPGFYTSVQKLMPWIWKTLDDIREKNTDNCQSSPCMNGGKCQNKTDDFECSCVDGYEGKRCEIDIDDCRPNPCKNGGKCKDGINIFSCTCVEGYEGERCETSIDDCNPNPCNNGGKCEDGINSSLCSCLDGFQGRRCEINIDDCRPNPCKNRGKCTDGINIFSCTCVEGFTGKSCETNLTCKRDLAKVEKGQGCRKSCLIDEDCPGARKKCRCDGWCGLSCFNPDADCPRVKNPQNGYVIAGKITYGNTVRYVCNKGFTLLGSSIRKCTSERKWSGVEPICTDFSQCGETLPMDPKFNEKLFGRRKTRAVGGEDALDNSWPWNAIVLKASKVSGSENVIDIAKTLSQWELQTAGTILNKLWILTVGHLARDIPFLVKNYDKDFVIVLGVTDSSSLKYTVSDKVQVFRISNYISHEKFDVKTFENDVGLFRVGERIFPKLDFGVASEITFNIAVRPICLPCTSTCLTQSQIVDRFNRPLLKGMKTFEDTCRTEGDFLLEPGSNMVLTGFGYIDEVKRIFPDRLQQVILKIGDKRSCEEGLDDINRRIGTQVYSMFNSTFCAVSSMSSKVMTGCNGDGGGPAMKKITRKDGRVCWIQVGINSFGEKCDGSIPEYYTKVSSHVKWIQDKIR